MAALVICSSVAGEDDECVLDISSMIRSTLTSLTARLSGCTDQLQQLQSRYDGYDSQCTDTPPSPNTRDIAVILDVHPPRPKLDATQTSPSNSADKSTCNPTNPERLPETCQVPPSHIDIPDPAPLQPFLDTSSNTSSTRTSRSGRWSSSSVSNIPGELLDSSLDLSQHAILQQAAPPAPSATAMLSRMHIVTHAICLGSLDETAPGARAVAVEIADTTATGVESAREQITHLHTPAFLPPRHTQSPLNTPARPMSAATQLTVAPMVPLSADLSIQPPTSSSHAASVPTDHFPSCTQYASSPALLQLSCIIPARFFTSATPVTSSDEEDTLDCSSPPSQTHLTATGVESSPRSPSPRYINACKFTVSPKSSPPYSSFPHSPTADLTLWDPDQHASSPNLTARGASAMASTAQIGNRSDCDVPALHLHAHSASPAAELLLTLTTTAAHARAQREAALARLVAAAKPAIPRRNTTGGQSQAHQQRKATCLVKTSVPVQAREHASSGCCLADREDGSSRSGGSTHGQGGCDGELMTGDAAILECKSDVNSVCTEEDSFYILLDKSDLYETQTAALPGGIRQPTWSHKHHTPVAKFRSVSGSAYSVEVPAAAWLDYDDERWSSSDSDDEAIPLRRQQQQQLLPCTPAPAATPATTQGSGASELHVSNVAVNHDTVSPQSHQLLPESPAATESPHTAMSHVSDMRHKHSSTGSLSPVKFELNSFLPAAGAASSHQILISPCPSFTGSSTVQPNTNQTEQVLRARNVSPHPCFADLCTSEQSAALRSSGGVRRGRRYVSISNSDPQSGTSAHIHSYALSCESGIDATPSSRQRHPSPLSSGSVTPTHVSLKSSSVLPDTLRHGIVCRDNSLRSLQPAIMPDPTRSYPCWTGPRNSPASSLASLSSSPSRNILAVIDPDWVGNTSHNVAVPLANQLVSGPTAAAAAVAAAAAAVAAAAVLGQRMTAQPKPDNMTAMLKIPTTVVTIHIHTHRPPASAAVPMGRTALSHQTQAPHKPAAAFPTHTLTQYPHNTGTPAQRLTQTPKLNLSALHAPDRNNAVLTLTLPEPSKSHLFDETPRLRADPTTSPSSALQPSRATASTASDLTQEDSWPSYVELTPSGSPSENDQSANMVPLGSVRAVSPPCSSLHSLLEDMLREPEGAVPTSPPPSLSHRHPLTTIKPLPSPHTKQQERSQRSTCDSSVHVATGAAAAGMKISYNPAAALKPSRKHMPGEHQSSQHKAALPQATTALDGRKSSGEEQSTAAQLSTIVQVSQRSSNRRAAATADLRDVLLLSCKAHAAYHRKGGRLGQTGLELELGWSLTRFLAETDQVDTNELLKQVFILWQRMASGSTKSDTKAKHNLPSLSTILPANVEPCLQPTFELPPARSLLTQSALANSSLGSEQSFAHQLGVPAARLAQQGHAPVYVNPATVNWVNHLHSDVGPGDTVHAHTSAAEVQKRRGTSAGCLPRGHLGQPRKMAV